MVTGRRPRDGAVAGKRNGGGAGRHKDHIRHAAKWKNAEKRHPAVGRRIAWLRADCDDMLACSGVRTAIIDP